MTSVSAWKRGGQAWLEGRAESADANDDRMRQESRKATEKYRRLLVAAGHMPATEANDRG